MRRRKTAPFALVAVLLGTTLAGCGLSIPADPNGTLEEVTGATLRVGVTESGRWVQLQPGEAPTGIEPDLVKEFASTIDAEAVWVPGSEHELVEELEHGTLDMVVGGIADDTPWATHAGLTRPYLETKDERGETVRHVMLVPKGENAFLVTLDKFLQSQEIAP